MTAAPWSHWLSLREVGADGVRITLEAGENERRAIARLLDLPSLDRLTANLVVRQWVEGARVTGRFEADLAYRCGLSLEPFPAEVSGEIDVRFAPPDSSVGDDPDGELLIDLEGDDPPDLMAPGERMDLAVVVVEHLSLELDPFPRKPGAVFEPPEVEAEISPFAALKALKREP